jgi:hypothetical protein
VLVAFVKIPRTSKKGYIMWQNGNTGYYLARTVHKMNVSILKVAFYRFGLPMKVNTGANFGTSIYEAYQIS